MAKDVFGIVGTTLSGTFLVECVVAEGGFGVVYRAEHVTFRAPVALKCLKIPTAITAEQHVGLLESFREEAEMLFHLSAQIPEVVRPLQADAVQLPNGILMPYIAMEWVDGTPLDSLIFTRERRGLPPLGLAESITMLTPIAHALARAHRFEATAGSTVTVVHCDLKPENVLICERGPVTAKLLDFGIAKVRALATSALGRITDVNGSRPFTPGYGAPEQWLPKTFGTTGPWTDVWGMALTLVECLIGHPPIDGDIQGMMGTALDPKRRPTPRNEGARISDDVEAVFARALAVDPRDRFTEMATFWSALERAAGVSPSFASELQRPASPSYEAVQVEARREAAPDALEFAFELDLEKNDRAATEHRGATVPYSQPIAAPSSVTTTTLPIALDLPVHELPHVHRSASSAIAGAPETRRRPAALAARPHASHVRKASGSPLARPLGIIGVGVALVLLDVGFSWALKTPAAIGPLRFRWFGALAVGLGIILALASFASTGDD